MMRSNSGMSWDFHHRRTKFFMSRVRSLPKHFLCSVTFLGTKTTMLLAPFVACSSYLLYAKIICNLDSLLEPIKNIVNPKLSGWKTHITIFSTIAVTAIHLTNAFRSQKWLYIHPSSFFLESLLIVLTQNQVASRIILLQPMRSNRLSRYWRLMKGYKVIFESWGEVYRSYSNGDKDRYACRSSRHNRIHDVFDRPKQPEKTADVFGIPSTKESNNMRILIPRKVTEHRNILGRLHTWKMKNFVRRWWKSHDTPEFERSIVAGTMRSIHIVSKRKGMPICDFYVAGGSWNILY